MITNSEVSAALSDRIAGTITEAEFTAILDQWNQQVSYGGLATRVAEQITRFDSKWSAFLDLTFLGPLDLVTDLPGSAAVGDTYWVIEAATGFPNGQAYIWIDGVWVAQGDRLTQGQTGQGIAAGGTAGQVWTKASSADYDLIWADPAGGGAGAWGAITGTLADQTDLQSALDAKAPLASPALTGNPTAPTQSAGDNSTKVATTAYADAAASVIIAAADAMVFKGVVDCSANPNYPAADRGHTYRVSVAGKIGGASGTNVEAGDLLLCVTDGTAAGTQASVGANWSIAQVNLDGAVIGPTSVTDGVPAVFDGTTGKLIKAVTFAAFKTSLAIAVGDIGGLGSGIATLLGTPTMANLIAAITGDTVIGRATTDTLTNKRITQRVSSTVSVTSPWAWNGDSYDLLELTALANALTINADAGTPTDGQKVVFRIKDNGTARALTWTTGSSKSFRAVGITLPTTTVPNKLLIVGAIYNAGAARLDVVSVAQEA